MNMFSPQESTNYFNAGVFNMPQNLELHAELQAQNENDYENLYLQEDQFFKLTRRHSKSTSTLGLQQEKQTEKVSFSTLMKNDLSIPKPEPKLKQLLRKNKKNLAERLKIKRSAYSSMMIFFNIKKFTSKLHEKIKSLKKLTASHIALIGDKASDTHQLLISVKQKNIGKTTLFDFLRLITQNSMKTPQQPLPQKSLKFRFKNAINQYFDRCLQFISKKIEMIPLIQPESTEKIVWDIFTALARSTLLYLIPIEIAFQPNILFHKLLYGTLTLIIFLIIDILVRLNTVCYVNGQAVKDRWEIFITNLKSSLWEDLLSLTPVLVCCFIHSIQILNLMFFLQFGHVRKVIMQTEDQLHLSRQASSIVNLSKFIVTLLFVSHIFSCIWFFAAYNYDDPNNWIRTRNLANMPWFTQYVDSFYYSTVTMLTIGYGDIVPQNNMEKTLAIFFMLISCIWLSYSINTVGTIVTQLSQTGEEAKRKMRLINRYMKQKNIGFALQFKIREYLNYCWDQENEIDLAEHRLIFQQLSSELKDELNEEAHSVFIKNSPLFKNHFSTQFKRKLMPYIKQQFLQPETVFDVQLNQNENNLCFIDSGQIELYTGNYLKPEQAEKSPHISKGFTVGLEEFLSDDKPKESYKSLGFVTLLTIPKSDFLNQIKDFPQDYEVFNNLRDLLIFSKINNIQTKECSACQLQSHTFISCPLMHLNMDRERIIKSIRFPHNQQRDKTFNRISSRQQYSALMDQDLMKECYELFYSEHQELIKQQCKYLPFSNDCNNTSHDSDYEEAQDQMPDYTQSRPLLHLKSIEIPDIHPSPQPTILVPTIVVRNSINEFQDDPPSPKSGQKNNKSKLIKRQNTQLKMATRFKNTLNKKHQEESLFYQYEQQVEKFNQQQKQNIISLHRKIVNSKDEVPLELEILKLKNEQQQMSIFQEQQKRFSKYMVEHNFDRVIKQIKPVDLEITQKIQNLLNYITFPWLYLMKYRRHLSQHIRKSSYIRTNSPTKRNVVKRGLLKNSKTIRINQIQPLQMQMKKL